MNKEKDSLAPVVRMDHVSKVFWVRGRGLLAKARPLRALDDVSLVIPSGKTVGCVGESGSGKTTLAKIVVRLESVDEGHVFFEGKDVSSLDGADLRDYRRKVQMVFQDPYSSLPPRMSVETILTEPLAIHGIGTAQERLKRARELVEIVGLPEWSLRRYPHQFSGGQRQRIAIARALSLQPQFLICDEPVSALDVSIQAQILNLLQALQERLGLSYLFITHDLRVVKLVSDLVAVLYLGHLVEFGPAQEVLNRPAHPYSAALLASVPARNGANRRQRLSVLEGEIPSPIDVPSGCVFHPRCPAKHRLSPEQQTLCETERPALREVAGGRSAACHCI